MDYKGVKVERWSCELQRGQWCRADSISAAQLCSGIHEKMTRTRDMEAKEFSKPDTGSAVLGAG